MRSTGSWYRILTEDGRSINARLKGKLKLEGYKTNNPVAVGDRVAFIPDTTASSDQGIITEILPRKNHIIRKSVHKTGHAHVIAANIDQAMLIATLSHPRTSLGFIDRFLAAAESFRIPQILVFNKSDLWGKAEESLIQELKDIYEPIDVVCLTISATEKQGLEILKEKLEKKITLLSGHSGVGKSTLVNALNPEISQAVKEISDFADKGVHTTTFAEMFEISTGTYLIDTPGIKEFGLYATGLEELSDYFPEMRAIRNQCKFHNCTHLHEPGCAVLAAVENGTIAPSRYESYLSMAENQDNRR